MLESIKKALGGKDKTNPSTTTKAVTKTINKSSSSTGNSKTTFGGLTAEQMKDNLEKSGKGNSSLAQMKSNSKSETIKERLDNTNSSLSMKESGNIRIESSSSLAEDLATIYSEGDINLVIDRLRNYLNQHKGAVDKRYWYMLMDCYQVSNNKVEFEKVALSFARLFDSSPPSWFKEEDNKKGILGGKNILILEPVFKVSQTEKFKEFLKAAKDEKFCRINLSPCKFDQSEIQALYNLHKLLSDLRKNRVLSVLMGDNNLVPFCKNYISPNSASRLLREDFLHNEQIFWLIYLEILQWKGRKEDFESLALDFAMKFEVSPPGWEDEGVMKIDKQFEEMSESEGSFELESHLTLNNIDNLLNKIRTDFETGDKSEIDLSKVDRIDFSAAGSISHFIQELWMEPDFTEKKVILISPNELILILLEMVGLTEFVEITNKKR